MPHYYCLGPQDAETKDQVWVAASSEKEARRSVALYHEPDALDPEKWFCRHDATRSPLPGVILTGGGRTITNGDRPVNSIGSSIAETDGTLCLLPNRLTNSTVFLRTKIRLRSTSPSDLPWKSCWRNYEPRALKPKKRHFRVYLSFHRPERSSLSLRQSGFSIVRSDRMSRHSCAIRTILFNRFGLP